MDIKNFLTLFGPVGYLLFTVSILLGVIFIERLITFYSQPFVSRRKLKQVIEHINLKERAEASGLIKTFNQQSQDWILPFMNLPRELAEEEANVSLHQKRQKLLRPLMWLNLFAVISPMIGLLGTIWSMSHSFAALAKSMNGEGLQNMILYLSEAMFATAFGILLALLSLCALYMLRQKAEIYLSKCEQAINQVSLAIAYGDYHGK